MRLYHIAFIGIILGFAACTKTSTKSPIPSIAFTSMTPDSVISGSSKDTVSILFVVNDGDGDLGNEPGSGIHDVYLKDSRVTTGEELKYFFPSIPKEAVQQGKGVQGYVTIKVYAALFLLLRPDRPLGDTLYYDIYVKDRAGNKSNVINTPRIYIKP